MRVAILWTHLIQVVDLRKQDFLIRLGWFRLKPSLFPQRSEK
jgi:hypothetical protein